MNYISEELRQFLTEWHTHATKKQRTPPFKNHAGLCANLILWCDHNDNWNRQKLYDELLDLLYNEFGVTDYPFGKEDYLWRSRSENQHRNVRRLVWVEKKLNIS